MDLRRRKDRDVGERVIGWALFTCAAISTVITVGIVAVLLAQTIVFFGKVSPLEFFTGTVWTPLFEDPSFGVLPLLAGSFLVAGGAALLAVPTGLMTAIFLSEYAPSRVRGVLKPILELLAGIPTVVYGYFALTFVTPILRGIFPGTEFYNAASASIVVGLMIIPTMALPVESALPAAVPQPPVREGAYRAGATRFEVADPVVCPPPSSGVLAPSSWPSPGRSGEIETNGPVSIAAGNTSVGTSTADPDPPGRVMASNHGTRPR